MPRTTHTLQKVERPSRSSFFQASVGGKKVYLGTDRVTAKRRLAALLGAEPRRQVAPIETVNGLVDAYLTEHPAMPERYTFLWVRFAGAVDLIDLKPDHLAAYHEYLKRQRYSRVGRGGKPGPKKPYGAKTIRHYLGAAASILSWGYQQGRAPAPPVRPKTAKPSSAPRDLPPGAVGALLAKLREPHRSIVGFIAFTGCRPSEACRLEWEWFRPDDGGCGSFVIPIGAHKTGAATGASRTIYLTPEARQIVDRRHRPKRWVFLNTRGEPFTSDAIQTATARRGLVSPYQLRHTFATGALARGAPLHIVGELLGHRSITTTEKYARVMSQQASAAAAGLSGLAPAPGAVPEPQTGAASGSSPPARQRRRRSQG